jgi:RNA polymerase sigma-70 factor (ECF subfamily)
MSPPFESSSVVNLKNAAINDVSDTPGGLADFDPTCDYVNGPEASDAELLSSLAEGREESFWQLWSRYKKGLAQICFRKMGGNVPDAEDILSQVMLRALDRLPSCSRKIVRLEPWLHQLARNLCVDLWRERRRRHEVAESWRAAVLVEAASRSSMQQVDVNCEIQLRIAALPPSLRDPLVLHVVREISSKQIASQLGLSPANVRKRVQRACSRLRCEMNDGREGNSEWMSTKGILEAEALLEPQRPSSMLCGRFPSTAAICTACVRLPCGVEQLFHVFRENAAHAPARRMKSLQRSLQDHPRSWRKRVELAELHHAVGDWTEAVVEWQRVLEKRPFLQASLNLGDTLLKLGEHEAAANVFTNARRGYSQSSAVARHLDGWIAFCNRDTGRSILEFEAAAKLEPENPAHVHALALAYRLAGSVPEALAAIERALRHNPGDLVALSTGHDMLIAVGQIEQAFDRTRQMLRLWPKDFLARQRLVDCRCRLGLTQSGAGQETKMLLRNLSRHSRSPFLIREPLAAFLASQGEPAKALAVHRRFVEQHSHCPRGHEGYSRLLEVTGFRDRLPAEPYALDFTPSNRCNGACNWCEM